MEKALTLVKLREQVRERYDHDEQRVVGIMMARYDLGLTKDIVEQSYQYWHHNTGEYFDVFWADTEHIFSQVMNLQLKQYLDFLVTLKMYILTWMHLLKSKTSLMSALTYLIMINFS